MPATFLGFSILPATLLATLGAFTSSPVPAQDQTARSTTGYEIDGAGSAVVRLNGTAIPYPTWFTTIQPGAQLEIAARPDHRILIGGEPLAGRAGARFWTAPEQPGTHRIAIADPSGIVVATVSVFVLEPSSALRRGRINGFRMGNYPVRAPKGFIRLNADDVDTPVSPNFKVGQFRGKQQPAHWPKYLLLTQNLVKRLQHLLDTLRADGVTKADTLLVMSGFRSPFYNTAIGATARSRHMWGDAADVYIDVRPEDGLMDDLNRDRKITKADANWLYDFAEKLFAGAAHLPRGGLGSYRANAVHGPFVHIDGRGLKARWGR